MKIMKTLIPFTFLLSLLLVACGPAGMEGYDEAYNEIYDEVSLENASNNSQRSELRRRVRPLIKPKIKDCEDRGLADYENYIDVIDDWNDYVSMTLSQAPSMSIETLQAGFEANFCPYNNPFHHWAGGLPTCQWIEVPQPIANGTTVSFDADHSNPATIRYKGCVYYQEISKH